MAEINDAQLVIRATIGEDDAFTEIVRRYRNMVYGYCYHRTGSFEDARDLAQETFVRAYTRLSQLRDSSKLGAWLRKIAANLCSRLIKMRREVAIEEVRVDEPRAESPDATLVHEALSCLPENERLVVVLHYVDGFSYSDIAGFLEISKDAVRGRLYRGREMLRTEMLKMTEETFSENRLDEKFVIDAVDTAIREAMDAYNVRQDKDLSLKKTDEAAGLLDGIAARKIKEPVALANALLGLASRETILGEQDRAHKHWDRAKSLLEQAGDQDGIEELRAAHAYERLCAGDFAAAHKLYSEAAEYRLRRRAEGAVGNDYDYVAAARALESLGLKTDRSRVVSFLAGVSWFECKDAQVMCGEGVALGFNDEGYPRNRPGPPPGPTPLPLVLIRNEPTVGDTLKFVNEDGRAEESVLESLSDVITTPAGTFSNCARTVSRVFASGEYGGDPVASRKLWLAPGVGITRIIYEKVGEQADTTDLVSYHVDSCDDFIPVAVGNWWKWRWTEGEEHYRLRTESYKGIIEANSTRFLAALYFFCVKR